MAPIVDDSVERLKDLVHKLESRVQQLEAKLGDSGSSPSQPQKPKSNESIRMILMGPPGAGMCGQLLPNTVPTLNWM